VTKKLVAGFFIIAFLMGQAPFRYCGMGLSPCCCGSKEGNLKLKLTDSEKSCCGSHVEKITLQDKEQEQDSCDCEIKDHIPLNNNAEKFVVPSHDQFQIVLGQKNLTAVIPKHNDVRIVFFTGPPGFPIQLYLLHQRLLI